MLSGLLGMIMNQGASKASLTSIIAQKVLIDNDLYDKFLEELKECGLETRDKEILKEEILKSAEKAKKIAAEAKEFMEMMEKELIS